MAGIDQIHIANEAFATSVIVGLGFAIGYDVNIYFPMELTEDEESAYQQDANMDKYPTAPDVAGNFPIRGLNIKRFQSDNSLDLYPDVQENVLYLPKELDIPNGMRVIVSRGERFFSFSGDVVDVFEGFNQHIFKSVRLEPMEVP